MTVQKTAAPLVLLMFTVLCALPAAAVVGVIPSAIAQEDDEENLGSSIVSDVLDGSSDDNDDNNNDGEEENDGGAAGEDGDDGGSNTQIAVPLTTQDQREANLAEQLGLDVDRVEEVEVAPIPPIPPTPTPPQEEEPPEFTVFCVEAVFFGTACFDTLEECEDAVGIIGGGGCEGFESSPPGGRGCEVLRDATGQPIGVSCPI
jgi:hypothetical protein